MIRITAAAGAALAVTLAGSAWAQSLDGAIDRGVQRTAQAQSQQDKIDEVFEETQKRLREYQETQKQIDNLEVYVAQLERQVANQERELDSINSSLEKVTLIERHDPVVRGTADDGPLGQDLLDEFDARGFIQMDDVFSPEETAAMSRELDVMASRPEVRDDDACIIEPDSDEVRSIFYVSAFSDLLGKVLRDPPASPAGGVNSGVRRCCR